VRGYDIIVVEDGIGDRDIPGVKGDELTKVTLARAPCTCGAGSMAGLVQMKQHTPSRSQSMTTHDLGVKVRKGNRNSMIYVQ
jgi:hypothetical protein